jgi:hypothetical protein
MTSLIFWDKQLNKIENSHQFSRTGSIGNPREFTQAEKQEQEVAEGCKRLIKNAITCWNYLIRLHEFPLHSAITASIPLIGISCRSC